MTRFDLFATAAAKAAVTALEAQARYGHIDLNLHKLSKQQAARGEQPIVKHLWCPSVFDHDDGGGSNITKKGHGLIRDYLKADPEVHM